MNIPSKCIIHVDNFEQYYEVLQILFRKRKKEIAESWGGGKSNNYAYVKDECICMDEEYIGHASLNWLARYSEGKYGKVYSYKEFKEWLALPMENLEKNLDKLEQKFK